MKTLVIKLVPNNYNGNKVLTNQNDISVSKDKSNKYAIYVKHSDFISMSTKNYPNIKMMTILKNIVGGILGNDKYIMIEAESFLNKAENTSAGIIWMNKLAPLIDKNKQMRVPLENNKSKKDLEEDEEDELDEDIDYISEIDGVEVDPSVLNIMDMFGDVNYKSPKKCKKKTSSSNKWNKSRLLKNGNNKRMKKTYRKHGVIIYNDKDDFKSDVKIIKSFLKDFIPGDEKWQEKFRHDLLKRWTYAYAISKKQAKRLSKEFDSDSKLSKDKSKLALDITKKLFTTPIDRWNDPNK